MPNSENIKEVGLRFTADNDVVFKKSVADIRNEMNLASAEYQKAVTKMNEYGDAIDYLKEKQELYNKQIDLQKKKIENIKIEIAELSKNEEQNANQIAKKKTELAKAEAQLNKYEKSLTEVNTKLSDAYQEYQKLEKELKGIENELNQSKADFDLEMSSLKNNATETEKLTTKKKALEKQTELQQKKVEDLQRQLDIETNSEEKNEEAIANKKLALTKAETELNNYQKELNKTNEELKKHSEITDKISKKMEMIGNNFTEVGKKVSVISGGVAALGTAAITAWDEVDAGMDAITKATGATGETAEMLERVYKNVAEEIVGDFETIGGAIGEVNTRFGFVGGQLNEASQDFLKFSEITGTDAVKAVQLVSRAMGDAGIESDNYKEVLDALSIAGQASGISIENLTGNITKYGAPMRALGYTTKESIAIFSSWEKAGVNTEIAFSGMKKAISNFASEGKDAKEEFKKTLEEIKKCPDIASATTKAIEIFGTKAGPDLADAIKGGRFEFTEMLDLIENSDGTLETTFNELKDGGYNAELAMQNVKLGLSEIGDVIQETVAPFLEKITKKVQVLTENFRNLDPSIKQIIVIIGLIMVVLGPLLILIGSISTGISSLIEIIGVVNAPILIIIGLITALIAVFIYLWNTNEEFRNNVVALWSSIQNFLAAFLNWLGNVFGAGFDEKFGLFKEILNNFNQFISSFINSAITLFKGILQFLTGVFTGDWDLAFSGLENIMNGWMGIVDSIFSFVRNIFDTFLTWLSGVFLTDWSKYFGRFGDVANGFSVTISGIITAIRKIFTGLIDFITGIFTGNWQKAWQGIVSIFSGIVGGLGTIIKSPLNAVIGLINSAISGINGISVNIPSWVPGFGGKTFGMNIPKIPYLKVGIANVPYDDYLAYLHQGERVLTKEENKQYNKDKFDTKEKVVNYNLTLNIEKVNNSSDRDIETLARELQFYLKKLEEAKG